MGDNADIIGERLRGLVAGLGGRRPLVQAIVAVESGDRAFRWTGTAGSTAAGGRVAEDTPFFIASIDKLYNAGIAMLLSEAGQLDVDGPIGSYLPATLVGGLHRYRGVDFSARITVRHLLTHTSGLADWLVDYPRRGRPLIESILEDGDRSIGIEELTAHVRDRLEPHFPPRDLLGKRPRARYSDTNFMLLAAIIEKVTGQQLHEVHRRMLHEPLGLRQTYFPAPGRRAPRAGEPMVLRAAAEPIELPRLIASIGGIYSTVSDMIAFLRALVGGELFQSPETLATMQHGWYRFGVPVDRATLRAPAWPVEYAMGLMRFRLPRLLTPVSRMPAVLGHTGSTGCWLFYCPERDLYLAGNLGEATAGAMPFRIVPRILQVMRGLRRADHE